MNEEQETRLRILAIAGNHDGWRERAEAMLAWVIAPAGFETKSWTPERDALLRELGPKLMAQQLTDRLNELPGKKLTKNAVCDRRRKKGVAPVLSERQRQANIASAAIARAVRLGRKAA